MPCKKAQRSGVVKILKRAARLKRELACGIAPRLLEAHKNALEDELASWKRAINEETATWNRVVCDLRRALEVSHAN